MVTRRALALAPFALSFACSSSGSSAPPAADAAADTHQTSDAGHHDAGPAKDAATHDATDAQRDATDAKPDTAAEASVDAAFDSRGPDGGWLIAPHDPMPQIVAFGGTVLANPVLTSVTFPSYDLTAEAEALVSGIGATSYWAAAVGEYGVGAATATSAVELTETAPTTIDDAAVQTWLANKLQTPDPAFPTPTASSVYVIFYPASTTVTLLGVPVCQHYGGYHNSLPLTSGPASGIDVTYAVVAECTEDAGTAIGVSEAFSHELTAAVTNPSVLAAPAYAGIDQLDEVWSLLANGSEVPDLCSLFADSYFVPTGYPYTLQRVWSDLNAAASHDPCQPSPAATSYFNSAPHLPDTVTVTTSAGVDQVRGVLAALNQPKAIEVDLYSDGPTSGPWSVTADDLSSTLGGGPYLTFAWDATTGQNGTKLHLTVTPLQASPYGGEPFEVVSTLGGETKRWYGFVAQN